MANLNSVQARAVTEIVEKTTLIGLVNKEDITADKIPPFYPYYSALDSISSPLNYLKAEIADKMGGEFEALIPPTVLANKKNDGDSTVITLLIIGFINTNPVGDIDESFKFRYDFSLDRVGNPQLNCYISFEKSIGGEDYTVYPFEVGLKSNSLDHQNVDLSIIETVKVFLFDKDPKTSRGTETTVQSGTGGN